MNRITSLNGIRFIFAFLVFVCHWYIIISCDYFRFSISYVGGKSVIFFFCLSGFFVGLKYKDEFDNISLKSYFSFIKKHFLKGYLLYVLTTIPFLIRLILEGKSLANIFVKLFLNVFCIQSLVPYKTSISINSVAWFTSCLFLLYIVSPFIIIFINKFLKYKTSKIIVLLISIVLSVLLSNFDKLYITPYYRVWQFVIGIITAYLVSNVSQDNFINNSSNILEIIAFVLCVFFTIFPITEIVSCIFTLLSDIVLISVLFYSRNGIISKLFSSKILNYLGDLSGNIYLIHFPVVALLGGLLKPYFVNSFGSSIVLGIILFLITLVISIIYKYLFEKLIKEK